MPSVIDPGRLARAVEEGYRTLKPWRDRFLDAIQEYGGRHYGEGDEVRRPVNLIAQACAILLPNLISEVPKHRVRSPLAELRGEATMLELALDRLWHDTDAVGEVRACVLDAILGPIGLLRVGMRAGAESVKMDDGQHVPVAEPYLRRISLEDYACDPSARNRRELRWEAIRYRMPRQEAIESGIFGRDPGDYQPGETPVPGTASREEAARTLTDMPGLEAKTTGNRQEAGDVGRAGASPDRYALIDTIELWDVFLYMGDAVWTVTIPATHNPASVVQHADKWLLAERWEGPDAGPLIALGFCEMPDNVMFKPVVADWRDLHDFMRIVSSKLANEAKNGKVVWTYTGETEDDAMSVKNAVDSGIIRVQSQGGVNKIEVVGIIKELFPVLDWASREWANASGNLPLSGGLSSEATDKTATAAQYLQANASQKIGDMRQRVDRVLESIDEHFGWYLTTDPLVRLPLPYRIPGGETVTLHYDAATRRGDFQSYNFNIERYSAVGVDPNVRLKRVTEFLNLVIQMIPLIQAGAVTLEGLARLGQQEFGIENLDELLGGQIGMGLQMQAHMARQGLAPGMGQPMPTPGLNPTAVYAGRPGVSNEQTSPIDAGRSALAVGVGG